MSGDVECNALWSIAQALASAYVPLIPKWGEGKARQQAVSLVTRCEPRVLFLRVIIGWKRSSRRGTRARARSAIYMRAAVHDGAGG